jgi:hypothetical protein
VRAAAPRRRRRRRAWLRQRSRWRAPGSAMEQHPPWPSAVVAGTPSRARLRPRGTRPARNMSTDAGLRGSPPIRRRRIGYRARSSDWCSAWARAPRCVPSSLTWRRKRMPPCSKIRSLARLPLSYRRCPAPHRMLDRFHRPGGYRSCRRSTIARGTERRDGAGG